MKDKQSHYLVVNHYHRRHPKVKVSRVEKFHGWTYKTKIYIYVIFLNSMIFALTLFLPREG